MSPVTLSDQAKAIAALEAEKAALFCEAGEITLEQATLLHRVVELGLRHSNVLARLIAIEDAQHKLVMPL